MSYCLTFRARGEVADLLLLGGEHPRLLVDISTEPLYDDQGLRCHTPRASFTIADPELMRRFLDEVKIGDIAEAEGELRQGNYIPHRTTSIDTVLTILRYRRISRGTAKDTGRAIGPADAVAVMDTAAARVLH